MTDSSTSKQHDTPPISVSNGHEQRRKNDIIGRTKLLLPSLNGLEQLFHFPSSETPKKVPTVSLSSEEIPSLSVIIPATQAEVKLSTISEPAEEPHRQFRFFSTTTASDVHPISATTSLHPYTQPVFQPAVQPVFHPYTQPALLLHSDKSSQTTLVTRKRLWRSLGFISLLCLFLIFGSFFYGYSLNNAGMQKKTVTLASGQTSHVQSVNNSTQEGTKKFQVSDSPSLILQSQKGDINIHAGNVGTVMVSINNNDNNQNTNIHSTQTRDGQGHDTISLATEPPDARSNYDITVPRTTLLQIVGNSGSISVDGISNVTIHTHNGNLTIGNVNGPIDVSTTSGDVTTYNITGPMTMQTVNGSIKGNTLTGQLQANTQNGDVIIQQAMLSGQSSMKTQYGSVRFTGALDPQGSYTMGTISGDVHLIVPANTVLQLHAKTGSGSIHNDFGKNNTDNSPAAQVVVNIGSGSVTVDKENS